MTNRLIPICVALLLSTMSADAEPAGITERIERAVELADTSALASCRSELERSPHAGALRTRYTLAYVNWREGILLREEKKERKRRLKEAQGILESIVAERPEDVEAQSLLGAVYGTQITGMMSGIKLGSKSSKTLERAESLDPDNPRVAFQRGVSAFRSPKSFGGSLELAEELLIKAERLFASDEEDLSWPSWGRVDAQAYLGQVLVKKGDLAGARRAYEQALLLAPDNRWIKSRLLPDLERLEQKQTPTGSGK